MASWILRHMVDLLGADPSLSSYELDFLADGRQIHMAGMTGFEPINKGVKVLCLTIWLHPCMRSFERVLHFSINFLDFSMLLCIVRKTKNNLF